MIRHPLPDAAALDEVRAAFSEQEAVGHLLTAAPAEDVIPASRLYAFACGDPADSMAIKTAMLRQPALRRTLRHMIDGAARYRMPEAIAASTTDFPERTTDGCRIQVVPSRAGEGVFYLVIEIEGDDAAIPAHFIICDPANRIEQIALPAPTDGIIQVMVTEESGVPTMLRNPKSAIFLR